MGAVLSKIGSGKQGQQIRLKTIIKLHPKEFIVVFSYFFYQEISNDLV